MKLLALALSGIFASASICYATVIYNGDFEAGTLAGWTSFTTPNGNLGPGLPTVTQFDVTGGGTPSDAAEFQVGETALNQPSGQSEQGGGIYQTFDVTAGQYYIGADFAAQNINSFANAEGGIETVSIDSVTVGRVDFEFINSGQTERGSVLTTMFLGAGTHQITIELTRTWLDGSSFGATPLQYVDDVQVTPVPEPSLAALGMCGLVAVFFIRRVLASQQI